MKYVPTALLNVFLDGRKRRKVGRLATQARRILFEYDPDFLSSGLQISPFQLPARAGIVIAEPVPFDGLFGVFNDSLPDGWGRLLLDRAVERAGILRGSLTPLDRLAYVGRHGMGALSYEPDHSDSDGEPIVLTLDKLAADAATVLKGEQGAIVDKLLKLNGASAGARPKVVAQVSADKKKIIHGPASLPPGYAHWMIKFPSQLDEADVGPIEYAYSLMARAAGIDMPETHLFGAKKKRYFGIKRFDRDGDRRVHMHSLSGLLHADHRTPSLDYDAFLKATQVLTKDITQVEKAFRLACFNVLAHNRDDHAKNFSYLLDDETGQWSLAPAYDLIFSSGPAGEQSMMVMGEGRGPGVEHLRALAKKHGLKKGEAILDEVRSAIAKWPDVAADAGVSKKSASMITARIAPASSKPARSSKKPAAKTPPAAKKSAKPKKPPAAKKSKAAKTARKR
ncbi:protein HipA [Hyphomicrobium nitrativorans NL23]|uniref:Protein HipA n=1 Tax=Hyphomicrobium nitrativorans NL23 TaxID=1029756 RepID=V5SB22_9HYPH|nr:type II toxin-antitoxin system HipA family toxin [Hyphomicrobium nitrativorans]AHB47692.1 protein HipA [Hyphomicrobium nitrativorans NL23]